MASSSPLDAVGPRACSGVTSAPQRMPSRSRTQSVSSDRPSTVAHSFMSPSLTVSPEAAFIAASAASQIITNDHDCHAEAWYDQHGIGPSGEPATVSSAALQLVNNFLDQLLFNFLAASRSTALAALRPAVTDVLKPKLAKDAINQADEELREYLGAEDDDAAQPQAPGAASQVDWDLELAWKRTRLRCMVYSSLGDMEEEDEDYYVEEGHLGGSEDRFSEAVSPAVAIFLTSILEFIGEQALIVAGQAAFHRMRLKYEKELREGTRSPTGVAGKVVVEELDMERVALDRTLGRLWRAWKKKIRSPAAGSLDRLTRSYSVDSMRSAPARLRSQSSIAELTVPATVPEPGAETENVSDAAQKEGEKLPTPLEEYLIAAGIPLPVGPNDVAEIEIPGLAPCSDDDEADGPELKDRPARPRSLMVLPSGEPSKRSTLTPSRSHAPGLARRPRSNSLPALASTRLISFADARPKESGGAGVADRPLAKSTETVGVSLVGAAEPVKESRPSTGQSDSGPIPVRVDAGDEVKDDEDDEVSIEEPRIVRSSRVSILGRNAPALQLEHAKLAAINTNLPARSPSIHSARLIEVTSPRSPVIASQRNSVAAESVRHASPCRSSRTNTPPVADDRPGQSPDSISGGRLTVNHVSSRSGLAASVSISETDEAADNDYSVSPMSPVTPVTPASQPEASLPTVREAAPPGRHGGSQAVRQTPKPVAPGPERVPEPSTPARSIGKVAVLPATASPVSTASTTSGTFFIESMPVLPEGVEIKGRPRAESHRYRTAPTSPPPAVPERSAGRQAVANMSAHRQPATIGQVSVERSRARTPSQSSSRSHDPVTGQPRQQHPTGSPASTTKLKVVRTSEDGVQSRADLARDFEELIHSDQTIQYTLTPESMRNVDSQSTRTAPAGIPAVSFKPRKSEEARQNGVRSRSLSAPRPFDTMAPASASGSNPSTDALRVNKNFPGSTGKHGGVVPRSIPLMPSKPRAANGPQAREARLPRESLAELAEFIRSTGPSGSTASSTTASLRSGGARNLASVSESSIEHSRPSTTRNPNRPKLQARDAAVDYRDNNSDLIDFIRRGPPSNSGNPRIPKAVAPFRTTGDSDHMTGAVGGRAVDAQLRDPDVQGSQASTTPQHSAAPSVQSSAYSSSALLAKDRAMPDSTADDDMPIPKRKTRRVRDPYAIDFSDEEEELGDDELASVPKKRAQTQEESLIDFLNNYQPPPEPSTRPLNATQTRNKPKKKASAPSLVARLTRRDGGHSSNAGSASPGNGGASQLPAESRSLSSRASGGKGGHIPIQVNMPAGMDPAAPPNGGDFSKAAAMTGGGPPAPPGGRVTMRKFGPRDAVSETSRATSDLAEFLKKSNPPPGVSPAPNQPTGPAERDEANGIAKVFARRKKASIS